MFTRWSPIYEVEVTENAYSAADRCAEEVLRLAAQKQLNNPAIADIGIGTGLMAQQIYNALPCRIAGLDFTEDMMAICAAKECTELLIKCDVGRDPWPLSNNDYDVVASAGLMEYLSADMLQNFLKNSFRILQHNGLLVFTYMPRHKNEKPQRLWHGHSGTYIIFGFTPEEVEQAVTAAGLTLESHSAPFKGCIFHDGSSYDYRLITAAKL